MDEDIRARLARLAPTRALRDAFAHFGAVALNPRWSWSARSRDGSVVVLTCWIDEVKYDEGKLVCDTRNHPLLHIFERKPGNRDQINNLIWARDNCGRRSRVVWCKARDTGAATRKAVKYWPDPNLWMQLTHLDEQTGEFRAESNTV